MSDGLLLYFLVSWSKQKHKHKLHTAQNEISCYILSPSSSDHIGQTVFKLLKLLKFKDRVKQLRLNHIFNIYNAQGATYLRENFTRSSKVHSHKTRSGDSGFIVPRVAGIASTTLYYNAILDWNALPPRIKGLPIKHAFKQSVMLVSNNIWLIVL